MASLEMSKTTCLAVVVKVLSNELDERRRILRERRGDVVVD
jgi:hypothetical protein